MTTDAAKAAKAKYDAKTAKYYSMKLNQNTDRDMIEHLEQQPDPGRHEKGRSQLSGLF